MKSLQKATVLYLALLSIFLPVKFASITMMPETTAYFPAELWEYILVNFPGNSLGIASGIGLLLSLLAFGRDFMQKKISHNLTLWAYLAAFVLGFAGFINASTMDYPLMAMNHIAAFLAYTLSIYFYTSYDENAVKRLFTWWSAGLILVLISGLHQYFFGFDNQLEFYYSEAANSANIDNIDLSSKMHERRIFATFSGCNILAGYLLLAGAIGFYTVYCKAGQYEPAKTSRILFCSVFSAALLFVLFNTGSRGAAAAIGAGLMYILFLTHIHRKYKIAGGAMIILTVTVIIVSSVCFGRTFGSFTERIGYWRSSFLMLGENFLIGSGWGDFFTDNMRFRTIELDETARGPHNLFLIFGSSCGIFAMLAVIFASLNAIVAASVKFYRKHDMFNTVILLSIVFFIIHAMLDINFQVAASMAIFCTLTVIASDNSRFEMNGKFKIFLFAISSVITVAALAGSIYLTHAEKVYDDFKNKIHLSLTKGKYSPDQIQTAYNEVEKCRPYSPFHAEDMAHYCMNLRRIHHAFEYIDLAISRSPERAGYYYTKANMLYRIGKIEEAQKNMKIARRLYPKSQKYQKFEDFLKKSSKTP